MQLPSPVRRWGVSNLTHAFRWRCLSYGLSEMKILYVHIKSVKWPYIYHIMLLWEILDSLLSDLGRVFFFFKLVILLQLWEFRGSAQAQKNVLRGCVLGTKASTYLELIKEGIDSVWNGKNMRTLQEAVCSFSPCLVVHHLHIKELDSLHGPHQLQWKTVSYYDITRPTLDHCFANEVHIIASDKMPMLSMTIAFPTR